MCCQPFARSLGFFASGGGFADIAPTGNVTPCAATATPPLSGLKERQRVQYSYNELRLRWLSGNDIESAIDGVEGLKSYARIETIIHPVGAFDIWDTDDCGEVDEIPLNGLTPQSLDFYLPPRD